MAFDDERSDIQMAVRSLDESNRLFDRLIKEQQEKDDQNTV